MKRPELTLSGNGNRHLATLLMFIILAGSLFGWSGCSASKAPAPETTPTVQQGANQAPAATPPANQPANQLAYPNFALNPAPLSAEAKILSLEGYGAKGALADKALTVRDMLMYAVQDEYLARGEYLAIVGKFGSQRPYTNIISSEETHLAYLKEVYLAYGLDFPTDTSAAHVVVPASLLEAAKTGVQAEIDNIAMYKLFLTYDLPPDVSSVFTALKNGSENHLTAFQRQVELLQ